MTEPTPPHVWGLTERPGGWSESRWTRAEAMRECFLTEGLTMTAVAQRYGVSRERVRQVMVALGVRTADVVRERRRPRAKERQRYEQVLARMATATPCVVCGAWNLRGVNRRTCSQPCADRWTVARYQLSPEARQAQRESEARWALAHPDKASAADLKRARRILAGDYRGPNRRYVEPNSKAAGVLDALGLEPPTMTPPPPPERPRCTQPTKSGKPCPLPAVPGGELCHVHTGLAELRARQAAR